MLNETTIYGAFRDYHAYYEVVVAVISSLLNGLLMYLVMTTENRVMRSYGWIVRMSVASDFIFTIVNVVSMEVVEIKGGVCFFLPLGPFRHSPYPYNFLMASLFLGAVYTTVLTLGMQFVYRYCALCRTPLTVPQFAAMYFAGVSSMFAASFASFFVFRGVTPQDTEILRQHPAYQEDTPVYMAVDPTSVRSTAHLIFTQVIIFGVYVVIVYTASKINKKVRDATAGMSKYTRKAHRQLNKVMIMQALYPGILLGTPVIVACVGVEFRLDVPWLGIYLVPSASLLPIVNAITVMTVIPSIRKRVFGRGWADAGSTSRGVSTELKQRNLSKSLPNVEF